MDFGNIDANQYFDFTKVDYPSADDSYFDKHADTETSISHISCSTAAGAIDEQKTVDLVENTLSDKPKKSRPVFHFTAGAYKATLEKAGKLSSVHAKNTAKSYKSGRLSNGKQQYLKQKHSAAASKIAPKKTASAKQSIQPIQKTAINGAAVKRTVPFPVPRPAKIRKATHPTTPECLKRSQNKEKKVLKSSEEIELEHIAVLQKQMVMHLKANKDVMKKKSYTSSALKPISMPVEKKLEAKKEVKKSLHFGGISKAKPIEKENGKEMESKLYGFDLQSSLKFATPLRTSTPYCLRKNVTNEDCLPVAIPKCPLALSKQTLASKLPPSHTGLFFIQKQARKKVETASSSEKSGNARKTRNVYAELQTKESNMRPSLSKVSVVVEKLSIKDLNAYLSPSRKAGPSKAEQKSRKNVKGSEKENKMNIVQPIDQLSDTLEKISFEDNSSLMVLSDANPETAEKKNQKRGKTPKKQVEDVKKLEVKKKQVPFQPTNKTRSLKKPLTDITQQQRPMPQLVIKRSGTEIEVKGKSLRYKNNDENVPKNTNLLQRVTRSKSHNTIEPSTNKAAKNTVPAARSYLTQKRH